MNLPSLPTDNLYKFISLFSLSIIVIAIGFISTNLLKLQIKGAEVRTEANLLEFELDLLTRDIKLFDKQISKLIDEKSKSKNKEILLIQVLIQDRSDSIKKKNIELNGKFALYKIYQEDFDRNWKLAYTGIPILFFITIFSFTLWYYKIQKFQDKLLSDSFALQLKSSARKSSFLSKRQKY